jgi:hypothetical protein
MQRQALDILCIDDRGVVAVDELATVIVHDSRFGAFGCFGRRLRFDRGWPSRLISRLWCLMQRLRPSTKLSGNKTGRPTHAYIMSVCHC